MTKQTITTLLDEVIKEQLDYDQIIDLPKLTWSEVCDKLELGNAIYESLDEDDAQEIIQDVVNCIIFENDTAYDDRYETDYDLKMAQGWGF